MKTTTRYECLDFCGYRQASLLLTFFVALAGCGSQAAGNAGKSPAFHATDYLLFPLALGALPAGGAGAPDARNSAAHAATPAIQAEGTAPGVAAFSVPGRQAPVARGINQIEQVVGSYSLASGERRAFIWTASHGMQDLNDLVGDKPADLMLSEALAISDAGAIVAAGNTGLVLLRPISRPVGAAAMPLGD